MCLCMCVSCSLVSNSLQPHGLGLARLFCPWDSPGKNTGAGCPFPPQEIFLTQGLNPGLLHCRQTLDCVSHREAVWCALPLLFSLGVAPGFSLWWLLLLLSTGSRHSGFSICSLCAQLLHRMRNLSRPGVKPVSPVVAGRFWSTVPPWSPN